MNVSVFLHSEFQRQFKHYRKKYRSLEDDLVAFVGHLEKDPYQGVDLGNGVHKVRMAVLSKGKGKSGGMRVITYIINDDDNEHIDITLLYLYDKNDMGNVSDEFIKYLLTQ